MDTSSPVDPAAPVRHRRRIKLIRPRLQFKLIGAFLGLSILAMSLQFLLFVWALSALSQDLPQDGLLLLEATPALVLRATFITLVVMLPLIAGVGILVTFRVAGPVHRLEAFLSASLRGEKPADCRLRRGDELQELCALINQATATLRRAENASTAGSAGGARADASSGPRKEAA